MIYSYQTKDKSEAYCLLKAGDMHSLLWNFHEWIFYEVDENDREEYRPILDKLDDLFEEYDIDIYNG